MLVFVFYYMFYSFKCILNEVEVTDSKVFLVPIYFLSDVITINKRAARKLTEV